MAVAALAMIALGAGSAPTAGGPISSLAGAGSGLAGAGSVDLEPVETRPESAPGSPGRVEQMPGADPDAANAQPAPPFTGDDSAVARPGELSDGQAAANPDPVQLDLLAGADSPLPVMPPRRIELYPGSVSVTPGQPLELHVSTPGSSYAFSVERLDATLSAGRVVVRSVAGRPGHDYRLLATFDTVTRTARANWPVTDRLDTSRWRPGVYVVDAEDSAGTRGHAIFVVRTPTLSADAPAFVFTALTYQAYNLWGGANLYAYAAPQASRVSFERPYDQAGGRGFWSRYDDRILAWLQRQRLALQYTTDYDLATTPPDVAPGLLILPQHAEYVPRPMRDWVQRHVNESRDTNVMSFGANGFYWQVRLASPRTAGAPSEVICYKDPAADPAGQLAPELATTRWRDQPVNQPEGRLLGAQYVAILGDGYTRYDLRVAPAVPADLLKGTGWAPGTLVKGLLLGEGDSADPQGGGIAIMEGQAPDRQGNAVTPTVTIRTSPTRGRIFTAGTFAWVDGLPPTTLNLGVPAASFERFNRNVLGWLGF